MRFNVFVCIEATADSSENAFYVTRQYAYTYMYKDVGLGHTLSSKLNGKYTPVENFRSFSSFIGFPELLLRTFQLTNILQQNCIFPT